MRKPKNNKLHFSEPKQKNRYQRLQPDSDWREMNDKVMIAFRQQQLRLSGFQAC